MGGSIGLLQAQVYQRSANLVQGKEPLLRPAVNQHPNTDELNRQIQQHERHVGDASDKRFEESHSFTSDPSGGLVSQLGIVFYKGLMVLNETVVQVTAND